MKGVWIRGMEKIPISRPHTDFVCSPIRGGGKSSLLEHRGETYMKHGHTVFDFFGSRDGEGLAWARNPLVDGYYNGDKKLLLVHSDNMAVDCSYDTLKISDLTHKHLIDYDVLVSASPLHRGMSDEYSNVNIITDLIYERGSRGFDKLVVGIVREASNLYYSRLRVDKNQNTAKAYMIYLIREARHMGFALELDTLKYTSIDYDIRILCDYTYFKAMGYIGFPDDLEFLYRFFKPSYVRNMHPSQFIILSKKGNVGLGWFPEVKWHKQEKENILAKLGIKVEPIEGIQPSYDMTRYKTVGDEEHVTIIEGVASKKIRNRHGMDEDKKSYRSMAKKLGRSPSTITTQVAKHNEDIQKHGFCIVCRRAGGILYQSYTQENPRL